MKKLLIGIITLLLIILVVITVIKGISIGGLSMLGIPQIKAEDEGLDVSIKEATKLASTDYEKKLNELNEALKKLKTEKNTYEEMVNVSTDSEVIAASQSYTYEIDMLYIRVENHAKSEGVNLKLDIRTSSSGATDTYNLEFTATGAYVQIEEFITDIEDDSKLGFKIENFKMTPSSTDGSEVQATFTCKDISIIGLSSGSSSANTTSTSNTTNRTNTTNKTNTTNTTSDGNAVKTIE